MSELNLNEMSKVSGGTGGSPTPLPERPGCIVYHIKKGDKLGVIARTRDALAADHVARFREAMEGLGYTVKEMVGLLEGRKEEDDGKLS